VRDRPELMVLEVRFRPTGVAKVDIRVAAAHGLTTISLDETPTSGPIAKLPSFVTDPVLHLRNAWSLHRLRHEVERSV
jgi:hypothetical protein